VKQENTQYKQTKNHKTKQSVEESGADFVEDGGAWRARAVTDATQP
jgi:putative intracellular protease/amidase